MYSINFFYKMYSVTYLYKMYSVTSVYRMILNDSADWSRGEINVRPDLIKHFWTPDIIIHDLIRYLFTNILCTNMKKANLFNYTT